MAKTAIIGYGSMGSMLLEQFLVSGVLRVDDVIVTTRSPSGAARAAEQFPGIETDTDNRRAAQARTVLLCVPPTAARAVLEELSPVLSADAHLVSVVGSLPLRALGLFHRGPLSRAIPSLPSLLGSGVTLVCHNDVVRPVERIAVERLFEKIGAVQVLAEDAFAMASNLTSCMPGFLAALLQEMAAAALRHSDCLDANRAEELLVETMLGTARLAVDRGMDLNTIVARTAPRGGVTEAGLTALRDGLPKVLDELFRRAMARRAEAEAAVARQFDTSPLH